MGKLDSRHHSAQCSLYSIARLRDSLWSMTYGSVKKLDFTILQNLMLRDCWWVKIFQLWQFFFGNCAKSSSCRFYDHADYTTQKWSLATFHNIYDNFQKRWITFIRPKIHLGLSNWFNNPFRRSVTSDKKHLSIKLSGYMTCRKFLVIILTNKKHKS